LSGKPRNYQETLALTRKERPLLFGHLGDTFPEDFQGLQPYSGNKDDMALGDKI